MTAVKRVDGPIVWHDFNNIVVIIITDRDHYPLDLFISFTTQTCFFHHANLLVASF